MRKRLLKVLLFIPVCLFDFLSLSYIIPKWIITGQEINDPLLDKLICW
jgi:hypothetical protein